MSEPESIARLMERLQCRDDGAWRQVYDRFAWRLMILASEKLDKRLRGKVEAEDVVQSVFRTLCRRQTRGEFQPAGWDELGHLLVCITIRKSLNQNAHYLCQARDAGREMSPGETDAAVTTALDREPLPEEVAMLRELVERWLSTFSERDCAIIRLKVENTLTVEQIAREVGCPKRTVERVLELARKRLRREQDQ